MAPIIHCVRHAQGVHNLSVDNHHILDPQLTPLGEDQSRALAAALSGSVNPDLILSSPMRRTLQTALLAFPAHLKNGVKITAWPEVQEVADVPCDIGRELAAVKAEFADQPVDFSLVEDGWQLKEGMNAAVKSTLLRRARRAREWLSQRPEKEIVLVTHGCFLHFLTDDWLNANNPATATDWKNTEVRSFEAVADEDGEIIFQETPQSRENRGLSLAIPSKEERLKIRSNALKTWVEWGIMLDD